MFTAFCQSLPYASRLAGFRHGVLILGALLLWLLPANAPGTEADPLATAEELLADKHTEKRGVTELKKLARSRKVDIALAATARLATYSRIQGDVDDATKLVEKYGSFDAKNLKYPRLLAFLEYTRCLTVDGRFREAIKRLDFANAKTRNLDQVRVVATYGDLSFLTAEHKNAIEHYQAAIRAGDQYFAGVESERQKLRATLWAPLRTNIAQRLNEAKRRLYAQLYGEDFAAYFAAREMHVVKRQYASALQAYRTVVKDHPDTVYAEASTLYAAECQIAIGQFDDAVKALKQFVGVSPLGLYRGEAMIRMGQVFLDQAQDTTRADQWFTEALDWIEKVTVQQRDVELFAVPAKAAIVAKPPSEAQVVDKFRLKPTSLKGEAVLNRKTAPWYLDQLAWTTHYYLGFLRFMAGDLRKAEIHFAAAYDLNTQMQKLGRVTHGTFNRRLLLACKSGFMVASAEERAAFRSRDQTRILLADFYALWEQWRKAEDLYRQFLTRTDTSKSQKAYALAGLAEAATQQPGHWDEAKRNYQRICEEFPRTPSHARALYALGNESKADPKQRLALLEELLKRFPRSEYGEKAQFMVGFIQMHNGQRTAALETFLTFLRRYPRSRFTDHVREFVDELKQDTATPTP